MVAITAVFAAIAAVLASTSVVNKFLTPRLPLYKLQTVKLFNLGMNWNALKATMRADVSLMNENYIKADVHKLRIDMYYPTWDGQELTHIGHVVRNDELGEGNDREGEKNKPHTNNDMEENDTLNNKDSSVSDNTRRAPLWSLQPRQPFEARDDLHMTLFHLAPRTMGNLLWSVVTKGQLVIPSTGVAHVRATGVGAQMTIGMICDNVLEVWSQAVVGRDCTVNRLATGWINMDEEHARLQKDAYQRHFDNTLALKQQQEIMTT